MSEQSTQADESRYPEAGDWVLVWGQVKAGNTHPEDVIVEFFSHSEQYACDVRTDQVVITQELPEFASRCTALFWFAGGDNELLIRCARHLHHGKLHRDTSGDTYADGQVVGHIEEG